ncbi:MAG: hypothetical protein Q4G71_01700 [Pseudomonadota bacterium]|nr:hypothetical protein [Pseudomonadota bacterium]
MKVSWIQRWQKRWRGNTSGMERELVERAAQTVMHYVGLSGRCDCLLTRDRLGRLGFLLRIETRQHIPAPDRVELGQYFGRKIQEMVRLEPHRLVVWFQDAKDSVRLSSMAPASTARIVAHIRAANPTDEERAASAMVEQLRAEVQQGRQARRRQQQDDLEVPATDLGALTAD